MSRVFFTKKEALESRKHYEFAFAEEVSLTEKKHKFHVGTHYSLFQVFLASPTKRFHEVIFSDLPIKMVFDLEKLKSELSEKEFEEEVYRILMALKEEKFGMPIIFDSSRAIKNSMHTIYPQAIFRNIREMEIVVHKTFGLKNPIIDYNIYKGNGTLRLPFATSLSSYPTKLLPFNSKKDEIDFEIFKLGLLHYFDRSFFDMSNTKIERSVYVPSYKTLSKYEDLIRKWAIIKGYHIVSYKEEATTIRVFLKNVLCLKTQRKHKSNKIVLTIDLNNPAFPSTYHCLDMETCVDATWHGELFSTILAASEMKKKLAQHLSLSTP